MKVYNTEIILKYINKKGKIKILGEEFVDNNKNNCKIIYNGIEKELNSCIINDNESNEIEIKLKIYKDIIDMSKMFSDCKDLNSISDLSKLNTNNVYNMSSMFEYCESLKSIPDISNWNTSNVCDMNGMFSGCGSLKSIPDISKWNTNKVYDMNGMFYGCESLKSLPDISKWKKKC